jgi:hypothetical protein
VIVHGINFKDYDLGPIEDNKLVLTASLNKHGEPHTSYPTRQPDERSSRGRARRAPRPSKGRASGENRARQSKTDERNRLTTSQLV